MKSVYCLLGRSSLVALLALPAACFGGAGGGGGGGNTSTQPLARTLADEPDNIAAQVANALRNELEANELSDLENYDWDSGDDQSTFVQRFSRARQVAAAKLVELGYTPPTLPPASGNTTGLDSAGGASGGSGSDCTDWAAYTNRVLQDIVSGRLFRGPFGSDEEFSSCLGWANASAGASRDALVCAAAGLYITIANPSREPMLQEDCAGISLPDAECNDNIKVPENGYQCVSEGGDCSGGEICCTDECRDVDGILWNPDADPALYLQCDSSDSVCKRSEDIIPVMPMECTTDASGYNDCAAYAFDTLGEMTGGMSIKSTEASQLPDAINAQVTAVTSRGTGAVDLMFIIDVTGSMSDDIDAVKSQVTSIISLIQTQGGAGSRVGLFTYGDECSDGALWRTFTDLTTDTLAVQAAVQAITITGGGDTPESVYPAVIDAMTEASWINPRRAAIVIGDAGPHGPADSCYDSFRDQDDAVAAATDKGASVNLYPILAPVY